MTRFLQRAPVAALISGALLTLNAGAATHIAAVTTNSVPRVSKDARKLPIDVDAFGIDGPQRRRLVEDIRDRYRKEHRIATPQAAAQEVAGL